MCARANLHNLVGHVVADAIGCDEYEGIQELSKRALFAPIQGAIDRVL